MSKTDFGFEQVTPEEKTARVKGVFSSVAKRYDIMNDLMSAGLHRLWKREAVARSGVCPGHKVLDLAGGTGDLSALYSKAVGPTGEVVLADINPEMLAEGRKKLLNQGITQVQYVEANAEALPFQNDYFDCVNIAFGLRNVTNKDQALAEMLRVLKPGGKVIILEFSKIKNQVLDKIYDAYSFHVIPRLGKLITRDAESYRYLVESIRRHPDQEKLKAMMEHAGFIKSDYQNLLDGVVAIHYGYKPS